MVYFLNGLIIHFSSLTETSKIINFFLKNSLFYKKKKKLRRSDFSKYFLNKIYNVAVKPYNDVAFFYNRCLFFLLLKKKQEIVFFFLEKNGFTRYIFLNNIFIFHSLSLLFFLLI